MGGVIKDLGPCQVLFDNVDIGPTFGDVIFRDTVEERPIQEDQKGTTEVDGVFVGRTVEVEAPLSRSSIAKLASVVPGATSGSGKLTVANIVGKERFANAKELVLKPIVDGSPSTDDTTWLTVFKASPRTELELIYNNEGQRVYKVIFKGYPDDTSGNVDNMWKIGS